MPQQCSKNGVPAAAALRKFHPRRALHLQALLWNLHLFRSLKPE